MVSVRNESYIARRRQIGTIASAAGIIILLGGMVLTFIGDPRFVTISFLALPIGWLVSQVGLYFAHRFVRAPRPDERIDEGLAKVGKGTQIYHYVLPVPHVALTPAGVIALVAKFQTGNITAEGYKWTQKGVGLRRFFGQDYLGNPAAEAEHQVKKLAGYISQNIPELADQELPLGAIIVFTTKDGGALDLKNSAIPAMHFTKLKGFWNQRKKDTPLPRQTYQALRTAFDAAAAAQGALESRSEAEG